MKFENTQVYNFEGAIRGMRNPMNSWNKSDSYMIHVDRDTHSSYYYIGKNDMDLMQRLIKAGSEHRKFMRQIFVSVDITAPLYWWSEFDTYKVGTVANSTSKMHKLARTPITLECFETDDMQDFEKADFKSIIDTCEKLRLQYLETKDKKVWKSLIRLLPESWLQTRTITMNYENVYSMIRQRMNHKLNEWSGKDNSTKPNFIAWVKTLPYSKELLFLDIKD